MSASGDQIKHMINFMSDEVLKGNLLKMHESLQAEIDYWPASKRKHHAWKGGYCDHVKEVMMIAIRLYYNMKEYCDKEYALESPLTFTLDDVILVSYVHDLDKLYRYKDMPFGDYRRQEKYGGQIWDMKDGVYYPDESAKVVQLCATHGIILSDLQIEGVSHHHGGFSCNLSSPYSYMGEGGGMTGFSTLIHSADLMSGYIFGYSQAGIAKKK